MQVNMHRQHSKQTRAWHDVWECSMHAAAQQRQSAVQRHCYIFSMMQGARSMHAADTQHSTVAMMP